MEREMRSPGGGGGVGLAVVIAMKVMERNDKDP